MITHSLSSAETPSRRREACAARPGTVSRKVIAPAWATTTSRLGRLGDDREVAGRPGPDRRERALPAVLLGRHEDDEELAVEAVEVAGGAERPDGRQDRGDAALHVAGAAAEEPRRRGSRRPTGRPSRWPGRRRHDVEVTRQDEAARGAGAWRPGPPRPARPMTTGSDVRGISSPGQSGSARTASGSAAISSTARPTSRSAVRRPGRDGLLGSGDARDPDERPQVGDQPLAIDGRGRVAHPAPVSHAGSAGSCRSGRRSR